MSLMSSFYQVMKYKFWYLLAILLTIRFPFSAQTVVYVSSSMGDDENNGLTVETPFKTINKAIKIGKDIKLKAGDLFYEEIELHNQSLSRYGNGTNPQLVGFKRILKPSWELVKDNIWRINLTDDNFSGLVEKGATFKNNIGCLREWDKDIIHGRKLGSLELLKNDWDFFQTEVYNDDTKALDFNFLYLFSKKNPNELKLEFSCGHHYGIKLYDSNISHVNVIGFGVGGMSLFSNSEVHSCRVDMVGGSMMHDKHFVCFGNGIDFWVSQDAYDCIIEDCYISRCFDCGGSIQASGQGQATPRNIVYRNNLFSNCSQAWEDFLLNDDVIFENCKFENNIAVYCGQTDFGYPQRVVKFCNILGGNENGPRGMIISNN